METHTTNRSPNLSPAVGDSLMAAYWVFCAVFLNRSSKRTKIKLVLDLQRELKIGSVTSSILVLL